MVRRPPRSTRTDTLVPYTTLCRAVFVVAARGHAADELLAEGMDGADALEGRHGAAQAVGLGRRKAGSDDGDLHGLFLEQRHAEGLLQNLLQHLGGIVDAFISLAPAPVGGPHVPLARPGQPTPTRN